MPFLFTSKFSPGTCRSHASSWDATTHDGPGNASPWYASTGDATQRATWDAPSWDERSAHNLGWFLMLIGLLHVSHKANKLVLVQDKKHASETCSSIQGSFPPLIWPAYIYIDVTHMTNALSPFPFILHMYILQVVYKLEPGNEATCRSLFCSASVHVLGMSLGICHPPHSALTV